MLLLGLLESGISRQSPRTRALTTDDRALLDVPQRKIPMATDGTKDDMVPIKMVRDTLAIDRAQFSRAKTFEIAANAFGAERAGGDGGRVGILARGNAGHGSGSSTGIRSRNNG